MITDQPNKSVLPRSLSLRPVKITQFYKNLIFGNRCLELFAIRILIFLIYVILGTC